jgi:hypothetical protein
MMLSACKDDSAQKVDYVPGGIERTSKEFLIPRDLRETIEKEYVRFIHKENIKNILPDEELTARIPREFLDVDIYLRQAATGTLVDHTHFTLPRGGGEIDLKNYVRGKKGSFYLTYKVRHSHTPDAPIKDLHVYFSSETKIRNIDGEDYGVGCQKYLDVTQKMAAANSGAGLQLNATDHRYLPVVGGVFYFVDFDPERKIFLGAIRLIDSRYPEDSCPEIK